MCVKQNSCFRKKHWTVLNSAPYILTSEVHFIPVSILAAQRGQSKNGDLPTTFAISGHAAWALQTLKTINSCHAVWDLLYCTMPNPEFPMDVRNIRLVLLLVWVVLSYILSWILAEIILGKSSANNNQMHHFVHTPQAHSVYSKHFLLIIACWISIFLPGVNIASSMQEKWSHTTH